MRIRTKIILGSTSLVLITVLSIIGIALIQKSQMSHRVGNEIDNLARSEAASIARDVYLMCRTAQESVQLMVDASLEVARDTLNQSGAVSLSTDTAPWTAVNQYTKAASQITLPKMMVGSTWLGQNFETQVPTPVVDKVKDMVGGTVTVFQRMNEAGDMLRVATNVEKLDGKRAVGTYIPKTNPDGAPNPVVTKVLKGETFRGRAFVVNAWYITAYEPIWNPSHSQVIGILYVGVKQENVESLRKGIMDITVGKSGYVFVLGGKGKQEGTYIISKNGERDKENILATKDGDGEPVIQNIINKALALGQSGSEIPVDFQEYPWLNQGETHMKVAAISYFAPWDWVIAAGYYTDDFAPSHNIVTAAVNTQLKWLVAVAIVMLIISFAWSVLLASVISRPLASTVQMVKDLQAGQLEKRLNLKRKDEIGEMSEVVDNFADNLQLEIITAFEKLAEGDFTFEAHGLIREPLQRANQSLSEVMNRIQQNSSQIAASSSEVADSSQGLAQGATEQASSLEEISASLHEMSSQTSSNAENANQARALAADASQAAIEGNQKMEGMVTAMAEINQAGENIGKIIKVIDEIAFQTNLLALNAAVEAARAGQHGKGFAVVAEEVRNLAARSAKAASETAELIEGSVEKTKNGTAIAHQTADSLKEIVEGISKVNDLVSEISAANSEQAMGISQINQGISQLDNVTQQNTASSETSAAVSEELSAQSEQMRLMLQRFVVLGEQTQPFIES